MEKYDAILKTINEKIANSERLVEFLRQENGKKDETIRMLKKKTGDLEQAYYDATSENNELTSENEKLKKANSELLKANKYLKDENNKLNSF